MKKDTSNIIDLDSMLEPTQPETITESVAEEIAFEQISIDMNEILGEWSYRLPKGYPTVVDGVFTERAEVEILNQLLEERGLQPLPLPEAKPVKDYAGAVKVVTNAVSKIKSKDLISIMPTVLKKGSTQYIRIDVDSEKSRELVATELAKVLGGSVQKEKSFVFNYNGVPHICYVKPVAKETATDTDVKEGLSVVISYYPDYLTEYNENYIDKNNYKEAITKLLKFLEKKDAVAGLSSKVVESCRSFLKKGMTLKSTNDISKYVSILNQNSSHANTFDHFFQKNPDWYIERDELFDEIRRAAKDMTKTQSTPNGLPSDKWCPGDIYFVKNGSEAFISGEIARAKKEKNPNGITILNNLFSNKFLEPESKKPIVAVSLKMEKAQAGKLKSALEQYTNIRTDYALDKNELTLSKENVILEAEKIRKQLLAFTSKHDKDCDVAWQPCDLKKVKDIRTLRCKLAAYKALNFIYQKVAHNKFDKLDDALVSLVVFGLGLIRESPDVELNKLQAINPPFFKAIAKSNGNSMSKPILFQGGKLNVVSLWDPTGKNKPEILIGDSENYAGISIALGVQIGENKFDCLVAFRPNKTGESQIVIELQKADHK